MKKTYHDRLIDWHDKIRKRLRCSENELKRQFSKFSKLHWLFVGLIFTVILKFQLHRVNNPKHNYHPRNIEPPELDYNKSSNYRKNFIKPVPPHKNHFVFQNEPSFGGDIFLRHFISALNTTFQINRHKNEKKFKPGVKELLVQDKYTKNYKKVTKFTIVCNPVLQYLNEHPNLKITSGNVKDYPESTYLHKFIEKHDIQVARKVRNKNKNLKLQRQQLTQDKKYQSTNEQKLLLLQKARENVIVSETEFFTIGIFEDLDTTMDLFDVFLPNLFKADASKFVIKREIDEKMKKLANRFTEKERIFLESKVLEHEMTLYSMIIWKFQTQLKMIDYK